MVYLNAIGTPEISRATVEAWCRHLGVDDLDVDALLSTLTRGDLPTALFAEAKQRTEAPILTLDGEDLSWSDLERGSARAGSWLQARGVQSGDVVLIGGETSAAFVQSYLGALRVGAVVLLANPGQTGSELNRMIEHSGARTAVLPDRAYDLIDGSAARPRSLGRLREVPLEDPQPLQPVEIDGAAPALLAYTSGTTGAPKAVWLSHVNLLASIRAAMLAWRWSADDVLVHALPLYHQHGLGGLHATLLAGSRAVFQASFDPDAIAGVLARERATVFFAVPAMYERLANRQPAGLAAAELRLAVSGSAALSPALAERCAALLGVPLLERYGSTESGLDISNLYDERRPPGAIGLPLPGVQARVIDSDGTDADEGEDGELVLRGPQVFAGYEKSAGTGGTEFLAGGWFRTGDVARVDPKSGLYRITGRLKELIVTGGLNVYPREVELALEEDPAVGRAAVVGIPSERWGEEVVTLLVPAREDIQIGRVLAALRGRIAAYKCPKRGTVVSELPTNAMGKLAREEISALALRSEHEGDLRSGD